MKEIKRPEVLSPAGDPEKLEAALRFGADAVYLAGKSFGMRAASDNFSIEELKRATELTHSYGKKIYLTLNTMPHGGEYPELRRFLGELRYVGIDAVIVADLGVLAEVKSLLPDMEIHISTQASICSPAAAVEYAKMGASRLVLARELTLPEIRAIREALPERVELEAFVHGAMCVSYSGRCMFSNQLTGYDANRGECKQPCRWSYTLLEVKRPDLPIPVEENEQGTFIMSSRDMCAIELIPELIDAGVNSFKIEGRVKSAYYTAVVTNAYKMAVEAYLADPEGYKFEPALMTELESVSHREYCRGFYKHTPTELANLCSTSGYIREKAYLALADEDAAAGEMCRFVQRNKLFANETVELISPGKLGRKMTVKDLSDAEGSAIDCAPHPGMIFYCRAPFDIKKYDILRAGGEESTGR